jgi:hypothetical protein
VRLGVCLAVGPLLGAVDEIHAIRDPST